MHPVLPAICLLAITLASPVAAANVDFDAMPVGCNWALHYRDGTVFIETYVGKQGDAHITEWRDGRSDGPLVARKFHNSQGYMTKRVWHHGGWEKFEPYSCYGQLGSCNTKFTTDKGMNDTIITETTRSGDVFTVKGRLKSGRRYPNDTYTLGPFGVIVTFETENDSYIVTDFKNCDLASS